MKWVVRHSVFLTEFPYGFGDIRVRLLVATNGTRQRAVTLD